MPDLTVNRPTSPGWYWVRPSDDSPWHIAHVVKFRGEFLTRAPQPAARRRNDIAGAARDNAEWIGPITPGAVAELARLRAAGDALADSAKHAALALVGLDCMPLRDQLCKAIADWLGSRIGPTANEKAPPD